MKVLYDHQIFQHQRIGGVSRYFVEIIKNLPQEIDADVSIRYSFNEYLKDLNFDVRFEDHLDNIIGRGSKFKGQLRLTKMREQFFPEKYPDRLAINRSISIEKIKSGDFDIFHPTFFEDYYLDIIKSKPFVLTVHDMILELYPEFTYSLDFVKRKRKLVNKAAHIIAVSENTKQDLINIFDIDPEKISVTYHASSLVETGNTSIVLPSKYILYVGDRRLGYKNFSFFITSMLPILEAYPELKIFCVGSSFTADELYFFNALGITERIEQRFVPDKDLYTVYNRAEAFVYPSYYEGFGIPILEAFQAKCPAILADASCFREVANDAALYFHSKSPNQLRANIISLLNSEAVRQQYITKGTEQLEKYSWVKSAQTTVDIYKKVLNR